MDNIFEALSVKKTGFLWSIPLLLLGSLSVLYPSVLGEFGEWTSWLFLTVAGIAALVIQVGFKGLKQLLGRMRSGSWKWILIAVFLGYLISIIAALGGQVLVNHSLNENVGMDALANTSIPLWLNIVTILTTCVSLFGEEVFTAAITLALYAFIVQKTKANTAWWWSVIGASLIFGLLHYTAYSGNLYQCLVVIGLGRLPFTYAWSKTDSLWGGIWAHIIYDLILMAIMNFI